MTSRSRWTGVITVALIAALGIVFFASASSTDAAAAATSAPTQPATPSATPSRTLPLRFRYRYYVDASLLIAETAKETKLTLAVVRRDMRQGMTLFNIGTANKADPQQIIKTVFDKEQTAIDRLLKYKLISQKKADTYLAALQEFLTEIMNFQFYQPYTRPATTKNTKFTPATPAPTATQ
jgi:hypothetical protein